MKPVKYFLLCSVLAGLPSVFAAAGLPPILDITLSPAKAIVDSSPKHREILLDESLAGVSEDTKAIELRGQKAITIGYAAKDPLFGQGPRTWILKCRFQEVAAARWSMNIFGRWDYATDQRVSVLILHPGESDLMFMLSETGTSEGLKGVKNGPLENNKWYYIVATFVPSTRLGLAIYDEKGKVAFDERVVEGAKVPATLFETETDFVLGALPEVGLAIESLRVWDTALDAGEIRRAILK